MGVPVLLFSALMGLVHPHYQPTRFRPSCAGFINETWRSQGTPPTAFRERGEAGTGLGLLRGPGHTAAPGVPIAGLDEAWRIYTRKPWCPPARGPARSKFPAALGGQASSQASTGLPSAPTGQAAFLEFSGTERGAAACLCGSCPVLLSPSPMDRTACWSTARGHTGLFPVFTIHI